MEHKFIEVKDGVVTNVLDSADGKLPEAFAHYIEVPSDFDGHYGDKWPLWFDVETGRRLANDKLVEMGELIDNRGVWHNKETRERKNITEYNEKIDTEEWTKETPIENEPCQKWDEAKKKFVVDTEKKELAEKRQRLAEIDAEIQEIERKTYRPLREKELGIDTEAALEILRNCESRIEELRPQRNKLETELKSA